MKYLSLILVLFLVSCSVVYEKSSDYKIEGPLLVTNVVDGDTLDLEDGSRVRLSGINTPEKGECYYKEAKEKLKELTLNKTVYLHTDYSLLDKYKRKLRYIYVGDIFVNGVLVDEGYARVFDKYKEDTRKYPELKKLEEEPIKTKIGVWGCS
jgi:micrococcal nuclease